MYDITGIISTGQCSLVHYTMKEPNAKMARIKAPLKRINKLTRLKATAKMAPSNSFIS